MGAAISNVRPKPDKVLVDIVDYVSKYKVTSKLAYETARNCLIDTLGCGLEQLRRETEWTSAGQDCQYGRHCTVPSPQRIDFGQGHIPSVRCVSGMVITETPRAVGLQVDT